MALAVVTGFIEIPDHPRSGEDYKVLGAKLIEAIEPHVGLVFDDPSVTWEDTWLAKYVKQSTNVSHSVADNPAKNSLAYHCVQHEKFRWLSQAADAAPEFDVYVWIDYGIAHLKDFDPSAVKEYLDRAQDYATVTMPGCWPKNSEVRPDQPCWRFCGGLIAVPKIFMKTFTRIATATAMRRISLTSNVEWETNTLARLEELQQMPITWYAADHDMSMFRSAP